MPIATVELAAAASTPVFRHHLRNGWSCEVLDRVESIDPDVWRAMFPPHWKDRRYFRTLEETFADEFPHRYLLLSENGRLRAIQPLFFVQQDLTVSLSQRLRSWLYPLRSWLTARLLVAGCVVGDSRIGVPDTADMRIICPLLDEAIGHYARFEGISILLYKDVPGSYREHMTGLVTQRQCVRLASLPAVSLELDFADFDEYVRTRLGKATRKSLRRKFRVIESLASPVTLEVKEAVAGEEAAELHALYERVALRGNVQFEVFTKEYFERLAERMPDQARFFIWRQAGRIVAFNFCTVFGDTIYDNDIGLDEVTAASVGLYHLTFRDVIRWALAQGLRRYESSPFNYHPKLHLRMDLVPLDLYARHTSPVLNLLLRAFARFAAPTRLEPILHEFANVAEL